MKKTILVALIATTLFACSTPAEKTASTETDATASSCVKEGPEVDLMKKFNVSFPIDKRLWREDILVIHILV